MLLGKGGRQWDCAKGISAASAKMERRKVILAVTILAIVVVARTVLVS